MITKTNATKDKNNLSINDAVELMSNRSVNIFVTYTPQESWDERFLGFDTITVDDEYLTMSRSMPVLSNKRTEISLKLVDIIGIKYDTSVKYIIFTLANGEEWTVAVGCIETTDPLHIQYLEEIDVKGFLRRLRKSRNTFVSNLQERITCITSYDKVKVKKFERNEVSLILTDSKNPYVDCQLIVGQDGDKFYIAKCEDDIDSIYVSLNDMPSLSALYFTFCYSEVL